MTTFPGVHVAIVTPFDQENEIDYGKLREHADWLIENGVHGLIPSGSVGEYASLTNQERGKVVETLIDVANGRVPVAVGTGAPSTREVIHWANFAKESGAKGLMSLPPINYRPTRGEVIAHYKELSKVGLPIIAYNNPHDYAVDLTPDLLAEIGQFDNIVAVKEFSGDLRRIPAILDQTDLEVLVGVDDLSMEGLIAGATGWIAGLTNALPKESVRLYDLVKDGKLEEARTLYYDLLPLFHYDAKPQLVQAIKYSMELAGREAGPTRAPRLPLEDSVLAEVKDAFMRTQGVSSRS